MENKIKNSIRIEFIDHSGDKHCYYNEKINNNDQIQFIGVSIARFIKSLGWSEDIVSDIIDSIDNECPMNNIEEE